MRRNPPRILAWLSLIAAAVGAPVAARLGRTVPAGTWRWCLTIGTALMILSFFWYPRRGENATQAKRRPAAAKRQGTAARSDRTTRREQAERAPSAKVHRSKQSSR